jgi:hypothetical protein
MLPKFGLLLPLVLLLYSTAFAQAQRCVNPPELVVTAADPETFAEICSAAEKAIAFLAQYNLRPSRSINIEIVQEKIRPGGFDAYGSYDGITDQIQLMSYASIFATSINPSMFGEPFDRVHYSGVIAHEVTHAVVESYTKVKKYSGASQEYLAYATQLATMPEARRNAIVGAMEIEPWQSGDVISNIFMAMNPGKFAVKSYLHLTTTANPAAFVQILLNINWFYVYVPKSG